MQRRMQRRKSISFIAPPPDLAGKLETFEGVFLPVCLTIWGVIMFLRMGFFISQAGVIGTLSMFLLGYMVNISTCLSICAISTNGTVRGGGPYYMISRSLGPEFGGTNFGETEGSVAHILPEGQWWSFLYGTVLLIIGTTVCFIGAHIFAKASMVLAAILLLSTTSIILSFFLRAPFIDVEQGVIFTGLSWETFKSNLWPQYAPLTVGQAPESYESVFAVVFPACVGILAGASMSGDLRSPSRAIPRGTLWVCW